MFIILPLFLLLLFLYIRRKRTSNHAATNSSYTLLALLGSGGHTAEMLTLLQDLFQTAPPSKAIYLTTSSDTLSIQKAHNLHLSHPTIPHTIHIVPRARHVKQSYLSSIPTTLHSLRHIAAHLCFHQPDIILLNGPATSAVTGLLATLFRTLGLFPTSILYIESLARVQSLSLSGRLLYPFADRFIVQWPDLADRYNRAEFYGRLC